MRTACMAAACAALAVACGCAGIDVRRLRDGMSREEVRYLMGRPDVVQVASRPGSGLEWWTYRKHYLPGIPNPLTDYDYIVPPLGGRETKLRFVRGRLQLRAPRPMPPPPRPTPTPAEVGRLEEGGEFQFYGIAFGMTKEQVQEAVSLISPAKIRRSRGGEWGDYQVLNLSGKMLGLYFKFDDKGRLYWMKAEYPYSRTDPGKTEGILRGLKEQYQGPVARSHEDVEISLDEARMRMTMVSKPLRAQYLARTGEDHGR